MPHEDTFNQDRLQKRVPDHICAACRRPFAKGQRIHMVFILLDPHAINPNTLTERGLELGMDYEFVHARCEDPFLDGRRVPA